MSELDTARSAMPTRAELLSVVDMLKPAEQVAVAPVALPAPNVLDAARAQSDQDAAALRDMTADRDSWRTAAQTLQTEIWRQMDMIRTDSQAQLGLSEALRQVADQQNAQIDMLRTDLVAQRAHLEVVRTESGQQREQIMHLTAAMAALMELAESRVATAPAPVTAPAVTLAATTSAATTSVPADATTAVGYSLPSGMEGLCSTQPPPPAPDPNAAPMIIPSLAPDTMPPPKSKLKAATPPPPPKVEASAPEEILGINGEPLPPEGDRVGVFNELAAVAETSVVPIDPTSIEALEEEIGPIEAVPVIEILPTPAVEPKKSRFRLS